MGFLHVYFYHGTNTSNSSIDLGFYEKIDLIQNKQI